MEDLSNNMCQFHLNDNSTVINKQQTSSINYKINDEIWKYTDDENKDKKKWLNDHCSNNYLETTTTKKVDNSTFNTIQITENEKQQNQTALNQLFSCSYTTVNARRCNQTDDKVSLAFGDLNSIGSGSFGIVFSAFLCEKSPITNQFNSPYMVAIKKIFQDKRYKNRELSIMRSLNHENIVKLLFYFFSSSQSSDIYLNLIMEYLPYNLHSYITINRKSNSSLNFSLIKVFTRQMFTALDFLHTQSICHRDIKPHNILVDPLLGISKICDFGSAKMLKHDEDSVSYICSRYYRAPELILGSKRYSFKIDVWSAGCVVAEMLMGIPIFAGASSVDQLVEIIKIIGTPTRDDLMDLNDEFTKYNLPSIKPATLVHILPSSSPSNAVSFIQEIFTYKPSKRPSANQALNMEYLQHE